MFMPLIIKNIETYSYTVFYTVFLTNSCLVLVFSAVRFCLRSAYGSAAPPNNVLGLLCSRLQVLSSMAEIRSSIDEIKVYFGTIIIFLFRYGSLQFNVKLSGILFAISLKIKHFWQGTYLFGLLTNLFQKSLPTIPCAYNCDKAYVCYYNKSWQTQVLLLLVTW